MSIPRVEGPLVFVFDRQGRLKFSREGLVTDGEIRTAATSPDVRATGPNFRFVGRAEGPFGFASWRQQARYSVVSAFGKLCQSCMAEFKHWSEPGGLIDWCAARPGDCQVIGIENGLPEPGQTEAAYLEALIFGDAGFEGLASLGVRVPVGLDPQPFDDFDGNGWLRRYFDGWLMAEFPEFGLDFRTVIWDREGKVVGVFKAEAPQSGEDPVLVRLKSLLEEPN